MKKFRKKPVVIEAIQWTGENVAEVAEFLGLSVRPFRIDTVNGTVEISTLEGTMTASKDDYIIKGVQGEFYPCKPDIFEQTYETVSGDEFITEVNITELLKVAEASEKQYDQVVKQNRDLQAEIKRLKKKNSYLTEHLEIKKVSKIDSCKFWDTYVFNEENPFNKENAYKELADYYFLLQVIPELYMKITGGTLSKTNYFAQSIYEAHEDYLWQVEEKYITCLERVSEELAYLDDNCSTELKELKSAYSKILKIIHEVL